MILDRDSSVRDSLPFSLRSRVALPKIRVRIERVEANRRYI